MHPRRIFLPLAALLAGAVMSFSSGCASPSQATAMVGNTTLGRTFAGTVAVAVSGGADTSSMGASNISNEDFAEAIKASIMQTKLFANVGAAGGTDYQINAQIVRLDRPALGLSFTVNLEVTWRLLRSSNQEVLWEKAVSSSFTATMSDAVVGTTRLRLANEGAARANISDALKQMSAVNLP